MSRNTKKKNKDSLSPTPFDLLREETESIQEQLFYIAVTKQLQIGDKLSGRHGNKGVISQILPFYDMPYLIDGTPVDIVLNPLGVPSRMNVGQLFESLLGFSGFFRHEYFRIPPFDENYGYQFSRNLVYSKLNELNQYHYNSFLSSNSSLRPPFTNREEKRSWITHQSKKQRASAFDQWRKFVTAKQARLKFGLNPSFPGKMHLIDGQTGETFYRPIIVGNSYILKLNHLVDDKIHSRTTGPYSLVTQQPLKGKRNLGGQRIGEMEVWSFYAFGSASILLELLTVKSDDIKKRNQFIKQLINTEDLLEETEFAESFRGLVLNLRALCINLKILIPKTNTLNQSYKNFFLKNQNHELFINPQNINTHTARSA
uniref:DNA-directed RNA polymerase n=1 Tax=Trentepohlia odorata TaxID=2576626 RepID=A0A4Y5P3I0_9CHLO|nr:rna polymerase beta-subunite [Trentepohlia odorata]QCW57821.1 rna polymerase beta-subunite [Trentepohlia odorata]